VVFFGICETGSETDWRVDWQTKQENKSFTSRESFQILSSRAETNPDAEACPPWVSKKVFNVFTFYLGKDEEKKSD